MQVRLGEPQSEREELGGEVTAGRSARSFQRAAACAALHPRGLMCVVQRKPYVGMDACQRTEAGSFFKGMMQEEKERC